MRNSCCFNPAATATHSWTDTGGNLTSPISRRCRWARRQKGACRKPSWAPVCADSPRRTRDDDEPDRRRAAVAAAQPSAVAGARRVPVRARQAVVELMRYVSPRSSTRVARRATEGDGTGIRPCQAVLRVLTAANRVRRPFRIPIGSTCCAWRPGASSSCRAPSLPGAVTAGRRPGPLEAQVAFGDLATHHPVLTIATEQVGWVGRSDGRPPGSRALGSRR